MGEELNKSESGYGSDGWKRAYSGKMNRLAESALLYSSNVRKFTGVKIGKTFPDAPSWWTPKDGGSTASAVWNCRRYADFLRGQGYVIIASGERIGSPWFVVVPEVHYDSVLRSMVEEAHRKPSKKKAEAATGEISAADGASNVPEASGPAAA
jgi:hypothetical protein